MIPDFAGYSEPNVSDCIFRPGDILSRNDIILIFQNFFAVHSNTYGLFKFFGIEAFVIFDKRTMSFNENLEEGKNRLYVNYKEFKYSSNQDKATLLKALLNNNLYWDDVKNKLIKL